MSFKPTISTSSLTFNVPRSTRPVTTVPRPEIVNTSSIANKNGLSVLRSGNGIHESTASINSSILASHTGSPSKALRPEPRITGVLSPSNPYLVNNSRTSISTRSCISGSVMKSHLFKNTTIFGTPT